MDAFLAGIIAACTPMNLLLAFGGCLLGTLVGVLPGIGAVSAVAILFPFTVYLPAEGMIIALIAVYYGSMYGGSSTAILMKVPGEVSSIVTAIDGYEMTRQGRAGPALAIAAISSFIAGIIGTFLIALLGPFAARLALGFGPAEYLGLGLFSLTAIASLAGRSLLRGAIVAVVGLILVSVGYDEAAGLPRLTFGTNGPLLQGLDIVPVMIGLFGVSEMMRVFEEENAEFISTKIGKLMPNRQELFSGTMATLRATALSFPLGLLPGMLPSVLSFLAYTVEKHFAKNPETFGKGNINGVAAAEASNNAAAMGNLLPLMSLGIPTGPTMALILAALTIYGLTPGPMLFITQPDFVWTVIGSFFVANIILLILNLPLVGLWVRLATIPRGILVPIVIVICMVGAFSVRNSMFDIWVCIAFGLIGYLLQRANWPVAPLVLAYVLGPMIERSARQVYELSPSMVLERPMFWVFIGLSVVSLWFSHRLRRLIN